MLQVILFAVIVSFLLQGQNDEPDDADHIVTGKKIEFITLPSSMPIIISELQSSNILLQNPMHI